VQWLGDQRASPPAWLHRMEEVWQSAGCFCTAVCCRTACCAYLRRNHGGCCWLWEQPALTNENPRPNHSNHYGSIPTKPPFSLSLRPYRNRIVSASAARETPPPELPAYRALPPLCPSICTCASTAVPLHLHMCLYRCAPPSAHVPPPLCPSSTMCAATAVPLHLPTSCLRCVSSRPVHCVLPQLHPFICTRAATTKVQLLPMRCSAVLSLLCRFALPQSQKIFLMILAICFDYLADSWKSRQNRVRGLALAPVSCASPSWGCLMCGSFGLDLPGLRGHEPHRFLPYACRCSPATLHLAFASLMHVFGALCARSWRQSSVERSGCTTKLSAGARRCLALYRWEWDACAQVGMGMPRWERDVCAQVGMGMHRWEWECTGEMHRWEWECTGEMYRWDWDVCAQVGMEMHRWEWECTGEMYKWDWDACAQVGMEMHRWEWDACACTGKEGCSVSRRLCGHAGV